MSGSSNVVGVVRPVSLPAGPCGAPPRKRVPDAESSHGSGNAASSAHRATGPPVQPGTSGIHVGPAGLTHSGTVQHEGATLGIMITTSGYGPGSMEFANGKPPHLIDGPGLISICQDHDIPARILNLGTRKRRP